MNSDVPLFSPDLAYNSHGYNASFFELFAAQEKAHFWFRARNDLIVWALGKYGKTISSFMEIGCGTRFVLQGIARSFPSVNLVGSEIYPEGISFASERLNDRANFLQMDARHIPFDAEFDAVGAFDLMEHIEDDHAVLQQICKALKHKGLLFVTVPHHRWLWSPVDTNACHVRRYSKRELHEKLATAGFAVLRSTSFVSSLLPLMLISRWFKRVRNTQTSELQTELNINPILNRAFEFLLRIEMGFIKKGISLPFGGSRLIVAIKI